MNSCFVSSVQKRSGDCDSRWAPGREGSGGAPGRLPRLSARDHLPEAEGGTWFPETQVAGCMGVKASYWAHTMWVSG